MAQKLFPIFLDVNPASASSDANGGTSFAVLTSGNGSISGSTLTITTGDLTGLAGHVVYINSKFYCLGVILTSATATLTVMTDALANVGSTAYVVGGRRKTCPASLVETNDTLRLLQSPDPTNTGVNGTWTTVPNTGPAAAKSIVSIGNSTPNGKALVKITGHGFVDGNRVWVASSSYASYNGLRLVVWVDADYFTMTDGDGNDIAYAGSAGAIGTVTLWNYKTVYLSTALNKTIDRCRVAWTSVGTLETAIIKQDVGSAKIIVAAGTGTKGYDTLPATLNLSTFQQVSFWVYCSAALPVSTLSLRLCTNTDGTGSVHTLAIPAVPAINVWQQVVVDTTGAMNSGIKSVSLVADLSWAGTIYIANIVACYAPGSNGLTLQSLIGKPNSIGAGGDDSETWYAIQSIDGKIIVLDSITNNTPSAAMGYYGTTEGPALWKRETIKLAPSAAATTAQIVFPAATLTVKGGYDSATMTSQVGMTWIDGQNGYGYCINIISNITLDHIGVVRTNIGLFVNGGGAILNASYCHSNNNSDGIRYQTTKTTPTEETIADCVLNNNTNGWNQITQTFTKLTRVTSNNNVTAGISFTYPPILLTGGAYNCICCNNTTGTWFFYGNNLLTAANRTAGTAVSFAGPNNLSRIYDNWVSRDTTDVSAAVVTNSWIKMPNYQTAGSHAAVTYGARVVSDTSIRHVPSGFAWKISVNSAARTSTFPVPWYLGSVICKANRQVTVSAWFYRDNVGLTASLVCPGGQIANVAADVSQSMTALANTWEQRSIPFLPTADGVVDIYAYAYGGTTYSCWVHDWSVVGGAKVNETTNIGIVGALTGQPTVANVVNPETVNQF